MKNLVGRCDLLGEVVEGQWQRAALYWSLRVGHLIAEDGIDVQSDLAKWIG
jgi:hypothetical protein